MSRKFDRSLWPTGTGYGPPTYQCHTNLQLLTRPVEALTGPFWEKKLSEWQTQNTAPEPVSAEEEVPDGRTLH